MTSKRRSLEFVALGGSTIAECPSHRWSVADMADIADVAIPILTLLILVALTYSHLRSIRRLRDASLTGPGFYEAAGVDPNDVHEALEGSPAHQCPFVTGLNGVGVWPSDCP